MPVASRMPATILNCDPEITRMYIVPLRMKLFCSSGVMLLLIPNIIPCATEACGSGMVSAISCDSLFLNA